MPEAYRDGTETLAYSYRLNTGLAPTGFEQELAAISRPILFLVGADDEAFIADRYQPSVAPFAPRAEVQVIEGVSHMGVVVGPETPGRIAEWLTRTRSDRAAGG